MTKSESIKSISVAIGGFQSELPVISLDREVSVKTKSGATYKFKYATIKHIMDKIRPLLTKYKLSFCQSLEADGSVVTILMHDSGEFITSTLLIKGEATPQGIGSAITYAKRYSITSMLGIIADDDDDANMASGNEFKTGDTKAATSYNHKAIETNGKPLLTNLNFKKVMERIEKGEKDVYYKTIDAFSLDEKQKSLLEQKYKSIKNGTTA